jgi:hypothetical protein
MSNLMSDRDTEFVDELHRDDLPMAAGAKICNGAAVALNAAGFAVNAGPGASHFRGIADKTVDNSDGESGDATIEIITPEAAYFDASGFDQSDVGQPVRFSDDHTVTRSAGSGNTYAGRVRSVESATNVLVDLRGAYVEPASLVSSPGTTAGATTGA